MKDYDFLEDFEKLDINEIEKLEKELGIKLPPSYKEFISNYNNAHFADKKTFLLKEGKGYSQSDKFDPGGFSLSYFLNFKDIKMDIDTFLGNTELNPKEFIPILTDPGDSYFFLCVKKGKNYGKIYYDYVQCDYTLKTLYYVADSIEDFLDSIVDDETYDEFSREYYKKEILNKLNNEDSSDENESTYHIQKPSVFAAKIKKLIENEQT